MEALAAVEAVLGYSYSSFDLANNSELRLKFEKPHNGATTCFVVLNDKTKSKIQTKIEKKKIRAKSMKNKNE